MHIFDSKGVEFSIYQLKDVAYKWYEEQDQSQGDDVESVLQDKFLGDFLDYFFTQELKDDKAQVFENFKQGRMTMKEQSMKFYQLSRYEPELVLA